MARSESGQEGTRKMSINPIIIAALKPTGYEIVPDMRKVAGPVGFAFNYWTSGDAYGDDAPQQEIYHVQVHLFCPSSFDSVVLRKQTKALLFAADFTFPQMTDSSDKDGQHWVFECEYATGVP